VESGVRGLCHRHDGAVIVLWLLNSSKQVPVAVGGYFKDPTGTSRKVGSNMAGAGENFTLTRDNMSKLKDQLQ
jgi:chemotaxis protein MotB